MVVEENIVKIKQAIHDESIIVTCSPPPKYLLPFLKEKEVLFIYKMVRLFFVMIFIYFMWVCVINFS